MSNSCELILKVPFCDLDPMKVVWHGNYLRYFDQARFALFERYNIDLYKYLHKKRYAFPITRTSIKHIFPLKYNDEFICKASVTEVKYKIVTNFEIRLTKDKTICTRGKSEQLAVKLPEMELQFEIPSDIRIALRLD